MKGLVLLFTLVTVLYVTISDAYTCSHNNISNGCSIPLNLPWFYKRKFKIACNHHDICYNCIPQLFCLHRGETSIGYVLPVNHHTAQVLGGSCYIGILNERSNGQGSRYGTSRSRCDSEFHSNMKSVCSRLRFGKKICRSFAKQYYQAVRRFGARRYRSPSPSWCRASWPRPCSDL